MRRAPQPVRTGYFGKLPAHADFVKAADNPALVGLLDQWLAAALELLSGAPRWQRDYDALRPLHFAFVGTRSRCAIGGRIVASRDASRRRFPFLTMGALEIDDPAAFLPLSPLVLAGLWQRLDSLADALPALAAGVVELDPGDAGHAAAFGAFARGLTLDGLQALLAEAGFHGPPRQLMLALGLLLRPVRASGAARLEKSLALPLPRAPAQRGLVASFWLALIAPFLRAADVELALFFSETRGAPTLVVGFGGAAPGTLQALIDPAVGAARQIGFERMDWVEPALGAEHALRRLSACLAQGALSLEAARRLFQDTFL